MESKMNPDQLTDRELLLIIHTKLENHLRHHDMYTKVALSAGFIGVVNFAVGLLLILIRFGLFAK